MFGVGPDHEPPGHDHEHPRLWDKGPHRSSPVVVGDHGRYFVGIVDDYGDGLARIEGYTWLRDGYDGSFSRKQDLRTKMVPVTSGTVIVYELPESVDIDGFEIGVDGLRTVACDRAGFEMDLSEGQ